MYSPSALGKETLISLEIVRINNLDTIRINPHLIFEVVNCASFEMSDKKTVQPSTQSRWKQGTEPVTCT